MSLPRTYLFVPGNRPERFDKALASGADAVILDLEDAVAPADKPRAREHVGTWARARASGVRAGAGAGDAEAGGDAGAAGAGAPQVWVRVNDESTSWHADDLRMLRDAGLAAAMLPKAEDPEQLARAAHAIGERASLIALVETARGVRDVDAVAAAPGVARIAFGTVDYALDLDLPGDGPAMLHAACRIAIASRAAGIASPIAGVTVAIDDAASLLDDLAQARACGFGAKLCIHPKQVAAIHAALAPAAAEVDWARRVLDAAASAGGAVQLDGKMVDRPVVLRAQAILARARA